MGSVFPLILAFVFVGILGACVAVSRLTVFRRSKRLRFSLGTLVGMVFTAGLCVTAHVSSHRVSGGGSMPEYLLGVLGLFVAIMLGLAFLLFCVSLTGFAVLRGIQRLRFTLAALVGTVFSGGCCATLFTCPRDSTAFMLGIVLTGVYVMVLVSHILGLGALTDAEFEKYKERQRARGALF